MITFLPLLFCFFFFLIGKREESFIKQKPYTSSIQGGLKGHKRGETKEERELNRPLQKENT